MTAMARHAPWGARLRAAGALAVGLLAGAAACAQAPAPCLLGDVRLFAGNFEPVGWKFANGQFLRISDHSVLFSLLFTTWGGDGMTFFGLPNLSSRIPMGTGQGLGPYGDIADGMTWGQERTTLMYANLPQHSHPVMVAGATATTAVPAAGMALAAVPEAGAFAVAAPNATLAFASVGVAGSSQSFETLPPAMGLNYIICVDGVYPSRY